MLRVCHISNARRSPLIAACCKRYISASSSAVFGPGTMSSISTAGPFPVFDLPSTFNSTPRTLAIAHSLVSALHTTGAFQITMPQGLRRSWSSCLSATQDFFALPLSKKASCVDERSFAGYIGSGREITGGEADSNETFTVMKDLGDDDWRVKEGWPGHGPVPWPSEVFRRNMGEWMVGMEGLGDTIVRLLEMGLEVEKGAIERYMRDGWHHLRVLRYPEKVGGHDGGESKGTGPHTDYGMFVIIAQDGVGGLFLQPPASDLSSVRSVATDGREDWLLVPPLPNVLTVIPGNMLEYLTGSHIHATLHKIMLNTQVRYSAAYFHEPNFQAVIKPLDRFSPASTSEEGLHYGTHFTDMFMRNYPDRITTRRIIEDGRYELLLRPELRTM